MTLQPEPLGVMTQGRLILHRRESEQPQTAQSSVRDQLVRDTGLVTGAEGGDTLLNIPPCSMAEEPGEQSQSLFRLPMSDPELDLECRHGARPKVTGPLTTQTIQEEARAAPTEERALQLRGTDFYLPLGGQPRILERKSWRAPIVTEQGNPGIYVQIDEWVPLYKGNVYVVDKVTGRMYLSKGEHLMRIAETVSQRPFQDPELNISCHVPEREHPESGDLPGWGSEQLGQHRGAGDEIDPLTPIPGTAGGIGRTPVPVAESTCRPGEEAFPPSGVPERGRLEQRGEPREFTQDQGELAGRIQGTQIREELEWGLPGPSDPREPPRRSDIRREVPPQTSEEQGGGPSRQGSPLPEQRIIEADKRRQSEKTSCLGQRPHCKIEGREGTDGIRLAGRVC